MRSACKVLGILVGAVMAASGAKAQQFVWAKQLGGPSQPSDQYAYGLAVGPAGSIYTVGTFQDTADFDPGPSTSELTSTSGGIDDAFVSKLDTNGNFLWAKQLGGADYDYAYAVAVDAAGNVYTVGSFRGTADFDPSSSTHNLTSAGGTEDAFISKLDTNGNYVWAKQLSGVDFVEAYSVAVDASGNVYTVGTFHGTADFNPGASTLNLTAAGNDAFISKLDTNGNFVWAKQLDGTEQPSDDYAYGVAVDASGNVYTVGVSSSTLEKAFVSKLNSAGTVVWVKQLGGTDFVEANSVALDASNNVYTAGTFHGTADFDPGSGTNNLTEAGSGDAFISKLDTNGNFVWAKRLGGTGGDFAYGVTVDGSGNVYTAGRFSGTADFDPGSGVYNLTSAGGIDDAFVSKLDSAGNLLWAGRLGGPFYDWAYDVAVDTGGNAYTAGFFADTADFDPGSGSYNLTAAGTDAFISKLHVTGGVSQAGDLVSGVPLTIQKAGNVMLTLNWGLSCRSGDVDYEVYEGMLGDFTSHTPVLCSTTGASTASITPSVDNRYFLVVPTNGMVEGSYGQKAAAVERPPSSLACLPQSVGTCP